MALYIIYEILNHQLNTFVTENNVYLAAKAHSRLSPKSRRKRLTFYKRHFVVIMLTKTKATHSLRIISTSYNKHAFVDDNLFVHLMLF